VSPYTPRTWLRNGDISNPFQLGTFLDDLDQRVDAAVTYPRTILNQAAGFSATTGGSVKYVSWDTLREDTLAGFNAGAPTQILIPVAGFYAIALQACWTANNTGARYIHVEAGPSGTERIVIGKSRAALDEGTDSAVWYGQLAVNDRIRVGCYQNSGITLNFGGYSRPLASGGVSANCELSVTRIGDQ
jgi:hypothetical protein